MEKENLLSLFKTINFGNIRVNESSAFNLEQDSVYRVFHRSGKIYRRFKDLAISDLTDALFPIIDLNNDYDTALSFLEYFGFDEILIKAVRDLGANPGELDKKGRIERDGVVLAGSYLLVKEVSKSIKSVFSDFKEKRGFLFSDRAVLTPEEALFLESWDKLGSFVRYQQDEEFTNDLRTIILSKTE